MRAGGRVGPSGPKKESDWPGPGNGPGAGGSGSAAGVVGSGAATAAAPGSWASGAAGSASGSLDPRSDLRELRGEWLKHPLLCSLTPTLGVFFSILSYTHSSMHESGLARFIPW